MLNDVNFFFSVGFNCKPLLLDLQAFSRILPMSVQVLLGAEDPQVTAGCCGLLCALLLDVNVPVPVPCPPAMWAELLGIWGSLQQFAVACSVLLWCELGEQVMGEQLQMVNGT